MSAVSLASCRLPLRPWCGPAQPVTRRATGRTQVMPQESANQPEPGWHHGERWSLPTGAAPPALPPGGFPVFLQGGRDPRGPPCGSDGPGAAPSSLRDGRGGRTRSGPWLPCPPPQGHLLWQDKRFSRLLEGSRGRALWQRAAQPAWRAWEPGGGPDTVPSPQGPHGHTEEGTGETAPPQSLSPTPWPEAGCVDLNSYSSGYGTPEKTPARLPAETRFWGGFRTTAWVCLWF